MTFSELQDKVGELLKEQEDFFIKFISYELKHKCQDDLYICFEMDGELILCQNVSHVFSPGPSGKRKVKFCPFCGVKASDIQ